MNRPPSSSEKAHTRIAMQSAWLTAASGRLRVATQRLHMTPQAAKQAVFLKFDYSGFSSTSLFMEPRPNPTCKREDMKCAFKMNSGRQTRHCKQLYNTPRSQNIFRRGSLHARSAASLQLTWPWRGAPPPCRLCLHVPWA